MSILDALPAEIASALSDVFRDGVLKVPSAQTSDGQGGFTTGSPVSHPCKALVDDFSDFRRSASGIPANDRKIIVLGATVSVVPKVGHTITVEGRTWAVVAVSRDPAAATYELQAR